MIFETDRLIVRKLMLTDFEAFHEMQSNHNVMRFVKPKAMTYEENQADIKDLIKKYNDPKNEFFIYAVERKEDNAFVGTIAFIKDTDGEDEIGYRFLEKYWKKGYGKEIVPGMINHATSVGMKKLIALVAIENIASEKILKSSGFTFVKKVFAEDLGIHEHKYVLEL